MNQDSNNQVNPNVDASSIIPVLKQIPIFENLEDSLHHEIIQHISLMYYPENYTVFNEGDEADALYIIKTGSVQVLHPPKEEGDLPKKVAEIGKGGFFGEMALVSDVPRNASIQTLEDSEIFILSKEDFKSLLNTNTSLAAQVSSTVISRMKDNENK